MELDLGQISSVGIRVQTPKYCCLQKGKLQYNITTIIKRKTPFLEKEEERMRERGEKWVGCFIYVVKKQVGNQIGSDTFDNGSDII